MEPTFLNNYILIPFLIFLARVCDVSIGTIRIMLLPKSRKIIIAVLAFLEMMIWLLAIRQILFDVSNVVMLVAFAGGFASGNLVGMWIEEKLAVGIEIIRIITPHNTDKLLEEFRQKRYGYTIVDAEGSMGKVKIIFLVIHRKERRRLLDLVRKLNPDAFFSVEDVKAVKEKAFSLVRESGWRPVFGVRKGK